MTDCLIVGGGLLGMLTARYLHDAGAEVLVLDQSVPGHEASWAGGGILSPLYPWRYPDPVTALATYGQQHYAALAEALAAESGVDPEWTQSGLLMLDEAGEAETALVWAKRHGLALERVAPTAVAEIEPALADGRHEGLWMPAVAQIRNPRLVKALRGSLASRGIDCREQTPVERLLIEQGRVRGVATPAGEIRAERVLVASGAWSAGLLAGAGLAIAVEPVRGQMILFGARPGVLGRIVLADDRYLIPRRDGHILCGSTLEHVGFDKGTTQAAMEELHAAAIERVPALADYPVVKHWAGLRPGSPQGIPYIGAHPEVEGLYVNAGHYRNGVVLGLASAWLAADLLLGRSPVLDPQPYAPASPH